MMLLKCMEAVGARQIVKGIRGRQMIRLKEIAMRDMEVADVEEKDTMENASRQTKTRAATPHREFPGKRQ